MGAVGPSAICFDRSHLAKEELIMEPCYAQLLSQKQEVMLIPGSRALSRYKGACYRSLNTLIFFKKQVLDLDLERTGHLS